MKDVPNNIRNTESCTDCGVEEDTPGEFRRMVRNTVIYCPNCDPLN